jgi:hypothetical protein
MIFVDTNVFMFAVGRGHPLKEPARGFFREAFRGDSPHLCTSAEVLQELLHAYLPVGRLETLDAAFELIESAIDEIWSVEPDDVQLARESVIQFPQLGARDLLHLASCRRRRITRLQTYDRALEAAFRPAP